SARDPTVGSARRRILGVTALNTADRTRAALASRHGAAFLTDLAWELAVAARVSRTGKDASCETTCHRLAGYLEAQHQLIGVLRTRVAGDGAGEAGEGGRGGVRDIAEGDGIGGGGRRAVPRSLARFAGPGRSAATAAGMCGVPGRVTGKGEGVPRAGLLVRPRRRLTAGAEGPGLRTRRGSCTGPAPVPGRVLPRPSRAPPPRPGRWCRRPKRSGTGPASRRRRPRRRWASSRRRRAGRPRSARCSRPP